MIAIITTILQLIPALIVAIKAIEAAIPGSGKGAEKLEAIRQTLEIADSATATLWPKLQGVIGVLVSLFNKTKAFEQPEAP